MDEPDEVVDPFDDAGAPLEEESGEDLFAADAFAQDYEDRPELDQYDDKDLDAADYDPMTLAARRRAEEELLKRDKKERREKQRQKGGAALPSALLSSSSDEENEAEFSRLRKARRTDMDEEDQQLFEDEQLLGDDDQQYALNLGVDQKGPLKEYLAMEAVKRGVARKFRDFLTRFTDQKGHHVYLDRINVMCSQNRESLEVRFMHLAKQCAILAIYIIDAPTEMLEIFDRVARIVVVKMYPAYDNIHPKIHVRITDLPVLDTLRGIRQTHLNGLIMVRGVVTRRTSVIPEMAIVRYNCLRCKALIGPIVLEQGREPPRIYCPTKECQAKKNSFEVNSSMTKYRNYQKIVLQESPGSVPAGRLPRTKEIILLWDLVDSCRPGEEIEVSGIYRNMFDAKLNTRNGFPVFATVIEANYIGKKEDTYAMFRLTEQDERQIRELASDPKIGKRIIRSIAPSIYGNENVKAGIALCMFGGTPIVIDKHRIRGDINLLMLGDPGLAKSQFLKYVEKTAARAVFTNGQGASAVGLTASVHKDPVTKEWTLSGGAMVLADTGSCLIDEFEKMTDKDRTSILEAMEQQSISVSKAGIVTTLQARCSVIAAANPIRGRYDVSRSFMQNVDLSEPILSRFDILIVLRDQVSPIVDEQLASFVVQSHARSHPVTKANKMDVEREATEAAGGGGDGGADADEEDALAVNGVKPDGTLTQSLLRKYIVYARQKCRPRLADVNRDKISSLYADLRTACQGGGMPMTVRHVESTVRMAEAHAKMHLREFVTSEDVDFAIQVMVDSFVSTQKFSVARSSKKKFHRYINLQKNPNELLLFTLHNLLRETLHFIKLQQEANIDREPVREVEISCEDFETRARDLDIHDVQAFYTSDEFVGNGFRLDREGAKILKAIL